MLFDWWVGLFHYGLGGPALALVIAAFVVLVCGNVVVWTLAGLKWLGRQFTAGFRSGWDRSDPNGSDSQSSTEPGPVERNG